MERTLPLRWTIFLLALTFILPANVFSSHLVTSDISYECIGNNDYVFTLRFYRDCAGVSPPATELLNFNSATCTNFSGTLTMTGITEVSPICPAQLTNSTCNPGSFTLPGVEEVIYADTVSFSQSCSDWRVFFDNCCRNNSITNLNNPGSNSFYIQASLDNLNGFCNNSPVFTSMPSPYICNGQMYCYNPGVYDPDGDSLVFSLSNPLDGPGATPIPYATPFTVTYPLADTRGYIDFDPHDGSVCVIPSSAQVAMVKYTVDEYRCGQWIGFTEHEFRLFSTNCANITPVQNPTALVNLVGGTNVDSNTVAVTPGATVSFDIVTSDANAGDAITLTTNLATTIPGASFTTVGTNPVVGTFTWATSTSDAGYHTFTLKVEDNACPFLGSNIYFFELIVGTPTPGLSYSYTTVAESAPGVNDGQIDLTVSGGVGGYTYQWSNGPTTQDQTGLAAGSYTVTISDSGSCLATVTVFVPGCNLIVDLGPDTVICPGDTLVFDPGPGYASYFWCDSTTLPTNVVTAPGLYCVTVTDTAGCTASDSVTVTQHSGPAAAFGAFDLGLTVNFTDSSAGAVAWMWDFGDGNTSSQQNPTHVYASDGTYIFCLTVADSNGCTSTACDSIAVQMLIGVEGKFNESALQVYPNPSAGIVTVAAPGLKAALPLRLIDLRGYLVWKDEMETHEYSKTFDLSVLPKGIYWLKAGNAVRKLVLY